jgi:RNA polymerase sigma-70 factor (ECF subfamily)
MKRYQASVFRKSLSMLKNREEALDITQDIFIKVFHALPEFRRDATFTTWLYAITVNTCLNHLEKMQRRPWWWLSQEVNEVRIDIQQDEELFLIANQMVENAELKSAIQRTMQALSPTEQEVLRLRYFEEMEYQAIAERLGIGLSAVKMRIKRAREAFIREFKRITEMTR